VIVQAADAAAASAAVGDVGGSVTRMLPVVSGVAARIPADRLAQLRSHPGVHAVTPDDRVQIAAVQGNDNPATVKNVFAREINADALWREGVDGRGVRVALIDTGVSPEPDVASRLVPVPDPQGLSGPVPCANFSGEAGCDDSYGHGTFMAGLIAGNGTASAGRYGGVAPGAEIVSVKIAGRDGSADVSTLLAAIQWVVSYRAELGIRVLNLSLGTPSRADYRHDPLNYAVERAWRSGIVVVVSAGNRGPDAQTISKPADDPLVLTVAAVEDRETPATSDDRAARFSGRGPTAGGLAKPDVVAPGARVISLRSPGSFVEQHAPGGFADPVYRRGSGTSMSAAIVSGVAALILQANPGWSPDRSKFALVTTARKVNDSDPAATGAGIVDAYAAARKARLGLANQGVVFSDGTGLLDASRAELAVSLACETAAELPDGQCERLHGEFTAQGRAFEAALWRETEWTGASWQGAQWYGASWQGTSWQGASWQGASWQGASWQSTFYGTAVDGSAWYGVWD
jgi:serine protease AprX